MRCSEYEKEHLVLLADISDSLREIITIMQWARENEEKFEQQKAELFTDLSPDWGKVDGKE